MKTVTYKTKAWVTPTSSATPQGIQAGDLSGVNYSQLEMQTEGWTYIGEATVTVQIPDFQTLVDNKVQALKKEAENIRADATRRVTYIEGQIKQLLCIENHA